MTWETLRDGFTLWDAAAVAWLLLAWQGASWLIEHPPRRRPSTSVIMADYRRSWMKVFVTRNPRIFDSQIVNSLRQGTSFFASASMIAIGGGFALIGNADRLRGVAQDLAPSVDPVVVLEIKIMVMMLFAANAFLKFVWSHRLFGYASVLMAAVPNEPEHPAAYPRARKAGEINVTAARSYNRGLRSVYFGIAASAWLVGAWALILATLVTLAVILRREFTSASREVLLENSDKME
ncbi:DUF599 domain-containing protein [Mameliella sp. CS4]|uniref:DUF599 domain-containing protein n=1 Tax=Mameliella sp. CS4 TaxID=2862329 RepID=UPI001C5EDFEB|nr:DUF599 domain-containing protein [Mameliella sp. CS4]MBW4981126.1 DUF599 domain-containing protein [Mameliella sp. CS4]